MRNTNLLAGVLGAAIALAPLGPAQQRHDDSDGVQKAIAFQRAKDRADAHQAKLEQRHPSVGYSNADRAMDNTNDGRRLPDPGPAPKKKE